MIEFFSTIKGVAESYPIIPAKKAIPEWVKSARNEMTNALNVAKCPGIFELFATGYVVQSPWDVEIVSTDDKLEAFLNPVMEELLGKPPAQIQRGDSVSKHIPKKPWSNKHILKLNTPWHVKSKYKLMMLPLAYSDRQDFESAMGILDPSVSSEINIQGYVNFIGRRTIKAGETLCHLIPMTNNRLDLIVRDMNKDDESWVKKKKFLDNNVFELNKNLIRKMYNTFIGKKRD